MTHFGKVSFCRGGNLEVVSLNSCDLFLSVLVFMQEQQNWSHKTLYNGNEIVTKGNSK